MTDLTNPIIADTFPPTADPPVLNADVDVLMRAIAHQAEITSQLTMQDNGLYREIADLRWRIAELERRLGEDGRKRRRVE